TNLFEYLSIPEDEPHEPIPKDVAAAAPASAMAAANLDGAGNGNGARPAAVAASGVASSGAPDAGAAAAAGDALRLLVAPRRIERRPLGCRYPGAAQGSLSDVSWPIAPGETIAVVGPKGAGKTTLVKLLTGLYRPTQGEILLDGVPTTQFTPAELRARVGV